MAAADEETALDRLRAHSPEAQWIGRAAEGTAELGRLYANGTISLATRNQLQRSLDLESARLSGGGAPA